MNLTDNEIARLIIENPTSRINYDDFDQWAGLSQIDNPIEKSSKRANAATRVNRILEAGMPQEGEAEDRSDEQVVYWTAYRLEVDRKDSHFQRRLLQESAHDGISIAASKAAQAFDRATKLAAYALGEKEYFRLKDKRYVTIKKTSPRLDPEAIAELRHEYRLLEQTQSVLCALLGNAKENIKRIEQLTWRNRIPVSKNKAA